MSWKRLKAAARDDDGFERPVRKHSRLLRKYRSAPPPDRNHPKQPVKVFGRTDERRDARRWPMDAEVEVLTPEYQRATPINVSKTGIRIAVYDRIPAGTDCDVRFKTRSGRVLVRRATVVWVRRERDGCLVGMHFLGAA